jgi:hypothetical protein
MGDLYKLKDTVKCNMDGFCSRKDVTTEYKNRRIGQAHEYVMAALAEVERDSRGRCHNPSNGRFVRCPEDERVGQSYGSRGRMGQQDVEVDSRGRCHNPSNGRFMRCPDDMVGGSRSRERVGQSYGSRGRMGASREQIVDNRGRCHASRDMDGYKKGQFMPCK